ncbi:MAG: hypothetical protein ABF649_17370 [Bacillus sp. (in: firmicutes)]
MNISTNKNIKDFFNKEHFELHSYLTYLLLHTEKLTVKNMHAE